MGLTALLDELAAGATIVTVNDRLARRLRQAWGDRCRAAGDGAWETPPVQPFGGWLSSLYAARRDAAFGGAPAVHVHLLTPVQAEAVWTRLIAQSRPGNDLLQPAAAAEAAADAWRLCHAWRVPLDRLMVGNDDSVAFAGWARAYDESCAREGWLDAARLLDWLCNELDHLALPERLVFAGFDEWTPQQTALLDAFAARGVAVVRGGLPPVPAQCVEVIEAADADAELATAARWAADQIRADSNRRIGIVVPDLEARREAAVRAVTAAIDPGALAADAGGEALPVNVSLGAPLAARPLVRDALLALDAVHSPFDVSALGMLLRSPFVGGAERERCGRAQLDVRLRDHGEARIMPTTLRYFAADCPLWLSYWESFRKVLKEAPRTAGPRAWAEILDAALSALGWPGERPLDSGEYQAVAAFRELLTELARLEPVVAAPIRRSEALAQLKRLAARRRFQPKSNEAPIQVLGLLEAAGLDFDRLWITGMDDRRWPARPEPNPFIPAAVQREYGLPHASAARELAFAEAITRRLTGAAPEVVVSWPARDGDVALRPSPLLRVSGERLEVSGRSDLPSNRLPLTADLLPGAPVGASWPELIRSAGQIETLIDDQAPPLTADAPIRGGTGLLKDQAACPFQAFARRRLGAAMPVPLAPGLDAAVRGQLVHAVLERFWGAVGDRATLAAMDTAGISAAIDSAVEAALAREAKRRPATLSPRLQALEQARLRGLLAQWLEFELARTPFEVAAREMDTELTVGGMTLQFRIDRIDKLGDGREAVIDYKTGHVGGGVWDGERPDEPQLPAYALARGGNVAAVLFASLRRGELGWRGIADDATGIRPLNRAEDANLAALQREWRVTLEQLAIDFRDGNARVDPKTPQTCRYCDLGPLCRVSEQSTVGAAFGRDDIDSRPKAAPTIGKAMFNDE
ncbi:MAG TPA: PD-(D/E)XK nuclease family protein [Gammaproteobacteria bacterium]|nr:PD-(D/E)XK nuclease family protein [Gammaproteobacteria bacterium]